MEYLTYEDVVRIHDRALAEHGGSAGIRDNGALLSSNEQPAADYFGTELYPTISSKAAILCYLLAQNHPFVDGNKRTAYASMELFLTLNGYELNVSEDEAYDAMLRVSSSQMSRHELADWVAAHLVPIGDTPTQAP